MAVLGPRVGVVGAGAVVGVVAAVGYSPWKDLCHVQMAVEISGVPPLSVLHFVRDITVLRDYGYITYVGFILYNTFTILQYLSST